MSLFRRNRPSLDDLLDLDTARPEDDLIRIPLDEVPDFLRLPPPDSYHDPATCAGCTFERRLSEGASFDEAKDAAEALLTDEERARLESLKSIMGAAEPPPFIRSMFDAIEKAIAEPVDTDRYTAVLSITRSDGHAITDVTASGPYELVRSVLESALSEGVDHL